jgi:indolepyruvate decarboxylase
LLQQTGIQYTTTVLGKSVISESHPQFLGVHVPTSDPPGMKKLFKDPDLVIIGLGAWTTSKDTAHKGLRGNNVILASNGMPEKK